MLEKRKLDGEIFCGGFIGRSDQADKKHQGDFGVTRLFLFQLPMQFVKILSSRISL
jgi:hypothetical protein